MHYYSFHTSAVISHIITLSFSIHITSSGIENYRLSSTFVFAFSVLIFGIQIIVHFIHYVRHDFLYVDVVLRWCFKVLHSVFLGDLLRFILGDGAVNLQVELVSDEDLGDVRVWVLVDAIHPGLDAFEGLRIREVKRYYHSVRLSVELVRYRPKPFLTCCIPYLNIEFLFTLLVFWLDEINSYETLVWV